MENRHSSPSPRAFSPRPHAERKRSNSLPIVEALGCSTQEAELILAESQAVVRRRQSKGGRRNRQPVKNDSVYRPQDHIKYLQMDPAARKATSNESRKSFQSFHSRAPSNVTDGSASTVTGPSQLSPDVLQSPDLSPRSPIEDYSANLTKYIQSQLNSIPTYRSTRSMVCPRSCPDLKQAASPPLRDSRWHMEMPQILEMPAVRPPLRSAFSAWSSTDDESDDVDDGLPPVPDMDLPKTESDMKSNFNSPSILQYYVNSSNGSFLLSSTPFDYEDQEPDTAKADTFPYIPPALASSPPEDGHCLSSAPSTHDRIYSSSAPSFSSASTASYFECKRPITLAPRTKERVLSAVPPRLSNDKVVAATPPFEASDLTDVHDVLVDSHNRVVVEGLSFDLVRDWQMPEESMTVSTPC